MGKMQFPLQARNVILVMGLFAISIYLIEFCGPEYMGLIEFRKFRVLITLVKYIYFFKHSILRVKFIYLTNINNYVDW